MLKPIKIEDGHDNFFTPLRIIMALMVIIGHAFVVFYGTPSDEPQIFLHYTPSYTAVNAFFIASGFLVTKSMLYRGDLVSFTAARILRIAPALIVHVFIVAFIIGAVMTALPLREYFTHPDVLKQPLHVLTFYKTDMYLPGVFLENYEQQGSAALWTLRYEVLAYIGTAVLFAFGFMKRKWMIAAPLVICALIWVIAHRFGFMENLPATLQSLLRFGMAYGVGAAMCAYQDKVRLFLPAAIILGIIAWFLKTTPEVEILYNLALAITVFYFAYAKAPKLKFLQKLSDTSYGIYIYHWVILQVIKALNPDISLVALILSGTALSVAVASLSWNLVEKPALARKEQFSKLFIRQKQAEPISAK